MSALEEKPPVNANPAEKATAEHEKACAQEQKKQANEQAKEQTQEVAKPRHHNKPFAYAAFHLTNFLGFHVLFNSTASLFIAYNLLPTKPAKAAMDFIAKLATPMNAAVSKVTTPIAKFVRSSAYKELSKDEIAAKIAHSSRSRVETAFMCIAGFLALWPVKILEDHRAGFMNFIDHVVHPFRSKEERKRQEIRPDETPKETWGNLIRARLVGLVAVFTADALQQRFNNFLTYEKGNIDTAVWKWGAKASDEMPKKWRTKLMEIFTRKHITLSGIQSDMLPHLLRTIDGSPQLHKVGEDIAKLQEQIKKTPDKNVQEGLKKEIKTVMENFHKENPHLKTEVERAIFAEQSRLLITKELFLTLLISTVIYICAKTPVTNKLFEKAHLKKKGSDPHARPNTATAAPVDTAQQDVTNMTEPSNDRPPIVHAKGRDIKPMEKHKKIKQQPFTERLIQEAEMANSQQLTV